MDKRKQYLVAITLGILIAGLILLTTVYYSTPSNNQNEEINQNETIKNLNNLVNQMSTREWVNIDVSSNSSSSEFSEYSLSYGASFIKKYNNSNRDKLIIAYYKYDDNRKSKRYYNQTKQKYIEATKNIQNETILNKNNKFIYYNKKYKDNFITFGHLNNYNYIIQYKSTSKRNINEITKINTIVREQI